MGLNHRIHSNLDEKKGFLQDNVRQIKENDDFCMPEYNIECGIYNKHNIEIKKDVFESFSIHQRENISSSDYINYYSWNYDNKPKEIKYRGFGYVISYINQNDKFSTRYEDCTSIVAVGKCKET